MVHGSIASDMNVSFNQLCSPVATITGPCNCVVYRDIHHLLKATSRSHSFCSNCVGDAAHKRSCGCDFVVTITNVIPLGEAHLRNPYI